MKIFESMSEMGHDLLAFYSDPSCGYRGIIAIHSTILGPALGGTRFWNYATEEEAIVDVLRLSRGMTYKNAIAGVAWGGGKSVIVGDNKTLDREKIFRAHGRFVETLGGRYLTAEDVGTSPVDMDFVHLETKYVMGLSNQSGDPSPFTARGVLRAMQAAAKYRWGSDDLAGRTVAIQGCGNVGYHLAKELSAAGAKLIVTDVEPQKVKKIVREFGATAVEPHYVYQVEADIYAPCALGATINDATIPLLKAEMVVGAANNQLQDPRHGQEIEKRGILYAPDYVANAGGVISGHIIAWDKDTIVQKIEGIYDTMLNVLRIAESERLPTFVAADMLAEQLLAKGRPTASPGSREDYSPPFGGDDFKYR